MEMPAVWRLHRFKGWQILTWMVAPFSWWQRYQVGLQSDWRSASVFLWSPSEAIHLPGHVPCHCLWSGFYLLGLKEMHMEACTYVYANTPVLTHTYTHARLAGTFQSAEVLSMILRWRMDLPNDSFVLTSLDFGLEWEWIDIYWWIIH